ncbi:37S ribosomal protein S23 mitochondrial [Gaertneriomyces sp. JEL0708]|nr:37S ribosomal protein S23 mitochondrial [Gaertneriomyces sp. JEL0708]
MTRSSATTLLKAMHLLRTSRLMCRSARLPIANTSTQHRTYAIAKAPKGSSSWSEVKRQGKASNKADTSASAVSMSSGPSGTTIVVPKWEETSMTLGEWTPIKAKAENHGEVLQIPKTFKSAADIGAYPKQLAQANQTAFMVRQATLSVIDEVKKEATNTSQSRKFFVLDGPKGIGKSVTLLQTASHFINEGWIVIYIPQPSSYVNGTEPYEPIPNTDRFIQAPAAQAFLRQFLTMNEKNIRSLKSSQGSSLQSLLEQGVKDISKAQDVLGQLLDSLVAVNDRKPVLVAIDQVNAFWSKTAYCDAESRPVLAHQLEIVRRFMQLLTQQKTMPNSVCLAATDRSDTSLLAPFFSHSLTNSPTLGHSSPSPVSHYRDLSQTSQRGTLLSPRLQPASYDPFASLSETHPKSGSLLKIDIPAYASYEMACVLKYYTESGRLRNGMA